MCAGRVACCPLVSYVDYAPRTLLRLEKLWEKRTDGRTDRQTDGRQTAALRLPLDAASVMMLNVLSARHSPTRASSPPATVAVRQ